MFSSPSALALTDRSQFTWVNALKSHLDFRYLLLVVHATCLLPGKALLSPFVTRLPPTQTILFTLHTSKNMMAQKADASQRCSSVRISGLSVPGLPFSFALDFVPGRQIDQHGSSLVRAFRRSCAMINCSAADSILTRQTQRSHAWQWPPCPLHTYPDGLVEQLMLRACATTTSHNMSFRSRAADQLHS